MNNEIKERYEAVLAEMAEAAHSAGRDPAEVQLLVVTKGHPVGMIEAVVEAGARLLGENYVEEAVQKMAAIGADRVQWHMIGHIQSRKAQAVCQHFAKVHSLDRLKVAKRLDRFAGEMGRRLPVLLECNVSGEASKSGFPAWDENRWEALVTDLGAVVALPNLEVQGLMCMPPWSTDPEDARPYFQRTVRLQQVLVAAYPQVAWGALSMGMSGDYKVAIEEGSTIVRVGTAILGARR
jgi:pyridoxal phosphate enzyme (YggS family)